MMVRISLITIGDRAYPFQSGIVGSSGDLGGIIFATIFWFQFNTLGKPFWFCGIICVVYTLTMPIAALLICAAI